MKVYRVHTQLENKCYSPGFYHADKEFLVEALKQNILMFREQGSEGLNFFIEETELNLEPLVIEGVNNGVKSEESSETRSEDQNVSGTEQSGTPSISSH